MARRIIAPTREELSKAGIKELRVQKYIEDLDLFSSEAIADDAYLSGRLATQESITGIIKAEVNNLWKTISDTQNLKEMMYKAKIANLEKQLNDLENRIT